MQEKGKFTKEAAAENGYNWEIVLFFMHDLDLLNHMWGNSSAHFTSILKGTATREQMENTIKVLEITGRHGFSEQSAELMLQYFDTVGQD